MAVQNHYRTLEVHPKATQADIRSAYRRLAFRYHPDKNPGDDFSEQQFKAIQAAYAIIGDPDKRKQYDRDLWLGGHQQIKDNYKRPTAMTVLKSSIRLRQYVAAVNPFTIDHHALQYHLLQVLADDNLELIRREHNDKLSSQFFEEIMNASGSLNYNLLEPVIRQMGILAGEDEQLRERLSRFVRRRRLENRSRRLQPWLVLLLTLLLCILIYMAA
jgi:molecular chaperone DnaJ